MTVDKFISAVRTMRSIQRRYRMGDRGPLTIRDLTLAERNVDLALIDMTHRPVEELRPALWTDNVNGINGGE